MRVISGTARGHGLKAPRHLRLRPTPMRVKEALFSSLGDRVVGAIILELFAGTGAFGIECLSRGAEEITFVEKDPRAGALIRSNLEKTRFTAQAHLWQTDVENALEHLDRKKKRFDLIFADPPYCKVVGENKNDFDWVHNLLQSLHLQSLLENKGLLLIEHFKKYARLDSLHFVMKRQFQFGDTIVSVFGHSQIRKENTMSAID